MLARIQNRSISSRQSLSKGNKSAQSFKPVFDLSRQSIDLATQSEVIEADFEEVLDENTISEDSAYASTLRPKYLFKGHHANYYV